MKIEIKCLEGNQWNHLPADKIKGGSILDFLLDEIQPTVCAVYEDDKPVFYVANTDRHTEMMRKTGKHCFSAQDFQVMLSMQDNPLPLIAHVFPDSNILDIRRKEKQESFG